MNEGVREENGIDNVFNTLIDVIWVHNWGFVDHKVI